MKRILTALCALTLLMAGCTPALAAEIPALKAEPTPESEQSCYPISVEEYTYGPQSELRINKVYRISPSEDPALIPTRDFERGGRHFYLLDMTRKDEVEVDTKPHTETVTLSSDTNRMDDILRRLDAEMEFATEDGYTGILRLDHTSVQVAADGYKTSTKTLSATRTYPNLSDADVSFIPKSITDNGKTLTLADIRWDSAESTDGEGGVVTRYTATVSYTGSTSSRYAASYTITADYTGEVSRTECSAVTYTAIFGSTEIPAEMDAPKENAKPDDTATSINWGGLKLPLMISGGVLVPAVAGVFVLKKSKGVHK